MRRVAVVTSASGSGGTSVGRELAARLGVPFYELDAIFWKPGWTEPDPDGFRTRVADVVATDAWVIDGSYQSWIGQLVLGNADVVVWLDLPRRTWLPRLVRRTFRRARTGEELWDGNYESLRNALLSRDSLLLFALRHFRGRRRRYPERFAEYRVVRLRSQAEVDSFLRSVAPET
jgi:adenylate kinase family enzyme